ncbi:MAG: hypothetical protein ABJF23_19465 [Bryobacteraceae bacterium]
MQRERLWPTWLACLLSLYPAYWLVSFLLFAAPAFSRVLFLGHSLTTLSVGLQGISASSKAPVPAPARRGSGGPSIPVALGAAAVLALCARKYPVYAGLTLAMIGAVGTPQFITRMVFRNQWGAVEIGSALMFFIILCAGLRLMLRGLAPESYLRRIGFLYASFVIPAAVILASAGLLLFHRQVPTFYIPMLLAPAALAALIVSFPHVRRDAHGAVTWHPVAVLMTLAILIAGGGRAGAQAFDRVRATNANAAIASLPSLDKGLPFPKMFFQKGVNFTAEFPGGYPSEGAREMLRSLPTHGVNSIALVPYGFVDRNTGMVRWGSRMEGDEGIEQLSRVAHQLNMKMLLKPQTMSQAGYPGDLEFPSAEVRSTFFAEYMKFVEHYAELAKRVHADMFCVGVEFQKLVKYEADWRKIIARAHEIYPGPLVYAATQGPEFESINFWDQLDYIGLNNYYPLPDDLSTTAIVQKVEAVQKKFQKPVIFTEAGFASFEGSHREPWAEKPGKLAVEQQARCYEAILAAFYNKPWFQGIYWWKVGTDGHGGPEDLSLTPWGKPAMGVVTRWYLQPGR